MQPSVGHQQPDYDHEYNNQYSQQVSSGGTEDDRPLGPSSRTTIEASAFYHPSPLPQYPTQSTYDQTSRATTTISQFPYAQSSLELKPFAAHPQQHPEYRIQTIPEVNPDPTERMCDVCQYPDPILVAPSCNHTFHSRCVHVWPMDACPACSAPVNQIAISPSINMLARPEPRSGKWTRPEENFIDEILREFDRQALPLAHGTPIRLVLAKMLNCSTMRLSKKFQKNALGKRTFRVTKPGKGEKALQFDPIDHMRRQRELSRSEQVFRQELVDQFRRENNTDDGAFVETQNLRIAVQQFWVSNLLKFAVVVGQPVTGLDVSDAKKRKRAMQLLRNGQFHELLSWHHHSPQANTASITTMPPVLGASSSDNRTISTSWNTSAVVYTSSTLEQQQDSGSSIPAQPQQHERPVKKLRTPEAKVEVDRFGLPIDQSAACPQYGRISSSDSSVSSLDYSQQFMRPPNYSPFSAAKSEKQTAVGYAYVLQQQQKHQMLPGLMVLDGTVHDHRNGLVPVAATRTGDALHASNPSHMAPWDDLLENMSSVVNASAASSSSHGISQGNDSSMHSWPSIHMM